MCPMDLQSAIEFHCNSIQSDCSFHLCILQPSHMVKVSKSFEPARKPQLVLCVRPTVVEIDGFEPSPVIFSQVCTLTALAAFALGPHSTLLSYTPICLLWQEESNLYLNQYLSSPLDDTTEKLLSHKVLSAPQARLELTSNFQKHQIRQYFRGIDTLWCCGHRGDLNPILHAASVMCYQVTLPGP